MAPKFGVGKQVIGVKGPNRGVHGVIINRLKDGIKNLVDIRWSNGTESRLTTAFIDLVEAGGQNNEVVGIQQVGLAGQLIDENVPMDMEEQSVASDSSEDSNGEDLGDLDG